jgi:ATP-dependent helicase HrpA
MPDEPLVISFPPELPVSQRREDISRAIRENQVVIIAGATGSGKTTQIPKMLLELGFESIGHTQPRRIAARTIAERIAEELGQEVGELVGYQVRFTDRVGAGTKIKLMTDGILLNQIHRDRDLKKYDAIIIDEAHERSLTVDFLLGYLKQLMPRRPDLKIIITSATIDPGSFSRHFDDAPIIEVSGRTYPVEVRYRPLVAEAAPSGSSRPSADVSRPGDGFDTVAERPTQPTESVDRDPIEGINAAIDELAREGTGDVLVFLSGEAEIRDAEDAIRGRNLPFTEVLPLYGRLSSADQHRVFQPSATAGTRRRIVLATNVAETSLTVPGIKYVIDAGTARISRYSVRSKIQRLPIEAISQASANQRSGRSGRTSDGIAIRLYSEEDFLKRPEFTEPEILRTNLAAVILQMISLGLGDIASFPFLQAPDSRGIRDGLDLLRELGAVEYRSLSLSKGPSAETSLRQAQRPQSGGESATPVLTQVGKQLSQLPIDPRLARMIIESKKHGTTREVMAIVAGLSIQDPRERPLEKRPQADQAHARFVDPTSDFLTLLKLWDYLKEKEKELSGNQFRRMCRSEYLNYLRIREWQDVYKQLTRLAKQLGLHVGEPHTNPDGIHRSLLAGLLSQIGLKDAAKRDYVGARQSRFVIFPGSALAKKQPNAIMSAELVETSRLFARVNGAIDPAWAEPIAGDLVKRSYSEPHWEKRQGAIVAYERVTLYGVPIVLKRRVQFSRIDPAYARELFIRHALVEGDVVPETMKGREWDFDRANRALRTELAELEERTRRRDILFDDEAIFEFYNRRLPADVASTKAFEGWWRKERQTRPDLLTMTAENLVDEPEATVDENAFPSVWQQGDQRLALTYRFEPGAEDDGVTVNVPIALLASLKPDGFDWQVPGFREELVTALIKTLPKEIRRNVVPAGDWARRLLAAAGPSTGSGTDAVAEPVEAPLAQYLADEIRRQTYTPVDPGDFDVERVPPHLRVTFAAIDERGRVTASSKVLSSLQLQLKSTVRASVAKASVTPKSDLERTGLTTWDFDELPRVLDTKHGSGVIRAYPSLVDEGKTVAIRLQSTPDDQARAMRAGVRRMLLLAIPAPTAYVQQHLTAPEKLILATSPYRSTAELFADCMAACIDDVIGDAEIFTKTQFEAARDRVSATIVDAMFSTVAQVSAVLVAARAAEKLISQTSSMALLGPLADAREQLGNLVYPGFVSATGPTQLRRIPVYLAALSHRITRLADNLGRDRVWLSEVQQATERYVSAGGDLPLQPNAPEHLRHARWMLEELRVGLFAQHLPTAEPVSLQRITKVLGGG